MTTNPTGQKPTDTDAQPTNHYNPRDLGIDGVAGAKLVAAGYDDRAALEDAEFRELAGIIGDADAGRLKLALDDEPLVSALGKLAASYGGP